MYDKKAAHETIRTIHLNNILDGKIVIQVHIHKSDDRVFWRRLKATEMKEIAVLY